jgi:hypothetical protein
MSDNNVTPIRPAAVPAPLVPAIDFAAQVRAVLDEQLPKLGEAMGVVSTCKVAIRSVYDCDALANPQLDGALGAASRMLQDIFGAFSDLEEAALELQAAAAPADQS